MFNMFNMGSRRTISESAIELATSVVASADSTADSNPILARIGVWVQSLRQYLLPCILY